MIHGGLCTQLCDMKILYIFIKSAALGAIITSGFYCFPSRALTMYLHALAFFYSVFI